MKWLSILNSEEKDKVEGLLLLRVFKSIFTLVEALMHV